MKRKIYKTKNSIEKWLKNMQITQYLIHDDLVVDVKTNVYLNNKNLQFLPIQFGTILGSFEMNGNLLFSLEGSPKIVEGEFSVMNNCLTTLKGSPQKVRHSFLVSLNNLTTLENGPETVGGNYVCVNNNIQTLKGFTTTFQHFIHGSTFDNQPLIEGLQEYYDSKEYLTKGYFSFCEIAIEKFNEVRVILAEKNHLDESLIHIENIQKTKQKI